mmetsp:Transcript_1907/g.5623  ORF Transcript_1907/g.5623 Transcript_1907/m.5623 type:complete len:494 (-) Transcript_1907:266-1747(-)
MARKWVPRGTKSLPALAWLVSSLQIPLQCGSWVLQPRPATPLPSMAKSPATRRWHGACGGRRGPHRAGLTMQGTDAGESEPGTGNGASLPGSSSSASEFLDPTWSAPGVGLGGLYARPAEPKIAGAFFEKNDLVLKEQVRAMEGSSTERSRGSRPGAASVVLGSKSSAEVDLDGTDGGDDIGGGKQGGGGGRGGDNGDGEGQGDDGSGDWRVDVRALSSSQLRKTTVAMAVGLGVGLPVGTFAGMQWMNFTQRKTGLSDLNDLRKSRNEALAASKKFEAEAQKASSQAQEQRTALQRANSHISELEAAMARFKALNQSFVTEKKHLVAELTRLNQTVEDRALALKQTLLAAESATQRRIQDEQAGKAMEEDLSRATERADQLEQELSDMVEREARQAVSFERTLSELGAMNQRLHRAEERERLLLEQLEELRQEIYKPEQDRGDGGAIPRDSHSGAGPADPAPLPPTSIADAPPEGASVGTRQAELPVPALGE